MRSSFYGLAVAALVATAPAYANTVDTSLGTLLPGGGITAFDTSGTLSGANYILNGTFTVAPGVGPVIADGIITRNIPTGQDVGTVTAQIFGASDLVNPVTILTVFPFGAGSTAFQSSLISLAAGDYLYKVTGAAAIGKLNYQLNVSTVPVPGAALLFAAGLGAVGLATSRRRRAGRKTQAI